MYLTLTENVTLTSPVFLFEFKNDQDQTSQYFIASDISTQTQRYNKFTITESNTPDNLNGQVSMTLTGSWTYTVREQESNTNLDPELSGRVVEIGKVKVIGTTEITYTFESNETKIVYNG